MKYLTIMILFGLLLAGCAQQTQTTAKDDVECVYASDCEGHPHVMCVGEWQCVNAECAYQCENTEPVKPAETETAPVGNTETVPEPTETAPEPEVEPEEEIVEIEKTEKSEPELSQSSIDYVTEQIDSKFTALSPTFKRVSAGDSFAVAFGVRNNFLQVNSFKVDAEFSKAYNDNNQPIIIDEPESIDWVEGIEEFNLGKGENKVFAIVVNVPDDVPEKGTYEFKIQTSKMEHVWKEYYGQFDLAVKVE